MNPRRMAFIRRYATGTNWGDVIRGLKPTAKINRRYATGGFQPGDVVGWSRDDSSVADATGMFGSLPNPWVETHG